MGIQDRDYYRHEGPSVLDSLMPSGVVCRWLIGVNVVVWVLQMVALNTAQLAGPDLQRSDGWVTDWFILDIHAVLRGEIWRLLSFAFLHAPDAPFHLIFNMLFLWWFGSDIEQLYGRKEFLAIYLGSALAGGLAYLAWGVARGEAHLCLGASGAVSTMLILCALHYPRRIIHVFMILPMPIWLFAILNLVQDAFIFTGVYKSTTAAVVHLAGAAFALAYYKWQRRFTEVVGGWMWWQTPRTRARLKLYRPEPDDDEPVAVSAAVASSASVDEYLEAKLDAVLEKIARTGKDSLTDQEEDILKQAAAMYKRRRN